MRLVSGEGKKSLLFLDAVRGLRRRGERSCGRTAPPVRLVWRNGPGIGSLQMSGLSGGGLGSCTHSLNPEGKTEFCRQGRSQTEFGNELISESIRVSGSKPPILAFLAGGEIDFHRRLAGFICHKLDLRGKAKTVINHKIGLVLGQ